MISPWSIAVNLAKEVTHGFRLLHLRQKLVELRQSQLKMHFLMRVAEIEGQQHLKESGSQMTNFAISSRHSESPLHINEWIDLESVGKGGRSRIQTASAPNFHHFFDCAISKSHCLQVSSYLRITQLMNDTSLKNVLISTINSQAREKNRFLVQQKFQIQLFEVQGSGSIG